MNETGAGYGPWSLVAIDTTVFILFACGFCKPRTRRDWRTPGLPPWPLRLGEGGGLRDGARAHHQIHPARSSQR
ncbi:MAG: hypothetical protein KDH15_17410 [Rhodocyclaceae bacterium]|nr:hypothetical protein [Rhodocyclaceae bacterium]